MPPEQAAGKIDEIGPLADVYSLGAMLYATLTGRPPFHAANVMETLKQVLGREPVSPQQLNPSMAGASECKNVVHRAGQPLGERVHRKL
jgi:serine/threonine protein kinase